VPENPLVSGEPSDPANVGVSSDAAETPETSPSEKWSVSTISFPPGSFALWVCLLCAMDFWRQTTHPRCDLSLPNRTNPRDWFHSHVSVASIIDTTGGRLPEEVSSLMQSLSSLYGLGSDAAQIRSSLPSWRVSCAFQHFSFSSISRFQT
jgi:hypothetical protein